MRREGLVDEKGLPTDPRKIVCLTEKKPSDVRNRLKELGYYKVKDPDFEYIDGRWWNKVDGSEIWRYDDPQDPTKVYYVRIDEFGHYDAYKKGWKGGHGHYHVATCDSTKDASPIPDHLLPLEREKKTLMDENHVPLDPKTKKPFKQHKNFEERFESGAITYDDYGNPSKNPAETHLLLTPE